MSPLQLQLEALKTIVQGKAYLKCPFPTQQGDACYFRSTIFRKNNYFSLLSALMSFSKINLTRRDEDKKFIFEG